MATTVLAAYIAFATSVVGSIVLTALSVSLLTLTVVWARRGRGIDRLPVLVGSAILSIILVALYGLGVSGRAWGGAYFTIPLFIQMVTLLPLVIIGWLAWFMGYGWLVDHRRHPLLIYSAVALVLVAAASVADGMEISGGFLLLAPNGTVWVDALMGVGMMLAPVLLFEGIRRGFGRDALP
jgi:hypothetical protein